MASTLQSVRRATVRTVVGGACLVGALEVTTHVPSQGRSSEVYHQLSDQVGTPLLRYISSPEQAHHLAIQLLRDFPQLTPLHRPSIVEQRLDVSQQVAGLTFPNPIGLAAGFDKDGEAIPPLLDLGLGFVEVGSVCRKAQPGNPSPRMFRLMEDGAIINRYGFNSQGLEAVKSHLQEFRRREQESSSSHKNKGLVGVNLGKNKVTDTPLEDYQEMIQELGPFADYLVVNVSCPNQTGITDLQSIESLEYLMKGCDQARKTLEKVTPLFVKLSPDLTEEELTKVAKTLVELQQQGKVDGIIVTNTTTHRPNGLQSKHRLESGGLSGRPLRQRSTECIRFLYQATEGRLPIIGVGGIFSEHDVYEKLRAGASVVQIYSGMVLKGPGLVSKLRHNLAVLMKENGYQSLDQVVGADHEDLYWHRRFKAIPIQKDETETAESDKTEQVEKNAI